MERLNHPVIVESNALEPVATFYVPPGNTISEIIELAKIPKNLYPYVVVIMNGIEVRQDQWDFIEPRDEDILGLHVIPLGGDGAKGILRMVALIAVAIAAPYIAGAIPGLSAVGGGLTLTGKIVAAGITLVGSLAINAIIPPPKPVTPSQSAAGDSYFINSQSNRARINETIPIVYGMHKLYGNLATAPSIFSAGTSSVFTALYDWGLGSLDVWDVRAGDTSISKFGGTVRHLRNVPNHFDPDQPELGLAPVELELINYPTKSAELNIELNKNNDSGEPSTGAEAKSAVVELSFPSGLMKFDKNGKEQRLSVQFNAKMRGPSSNYQWVNLPSGTKGFAGDHFQVSGGFIGRGNDFPNPNDPAGVSVLLDEYSIESGDKVFVTLDFNQPTYFIRPQSDLFFIDASNSSRAPAFDFNETPNAADYPPEWLLVTGDQPAKGVFVIEEGRKYGFEFLTNGVKNGYYVCRTNMENFRDDAPPDGYFFPAGVVNSDQIAVGDKDSNGDINPPVVEALYSEIEGNETYLRIIQTQISRGGERGRWIDQPDSAMLFYKGQNIPVTVILVPEYKGRLQKTVEESTVIYSVRTRAQYYALKLAPSSISSYGIGTAPAFDFNVDIGGDYVTRSTFNVSGNKLTAGKVSLVIPFAVEGQYDIQISRVGDHENYEGDDRFIESCVWTRLTTRGYPASQVGERRGILNLQKKHTMTEIEFQASGNVQGNVQQISAMVRQYLRWHDGDAWREPETRPTVSSNPAYIVLDLLTGYSIQNSTDIPAKFDFDGGWISDSQLDFKAFNRFANHCNEVVTYTDNFGETQSRNRYHINTIIASQSPIIETVNNILSMARAQLIINQQGQVSVMLDSDKELDGSLKVPRQLFTSQNSWSFSASRQFVDLPHALNVSFVDPSLGYQSGVYRIFRPGYNNRNSTIFEDISSFGVTNWHQAAQWGMYQLAQGVLRSESFTLTVDVESLVVQRGDLVEIAHDAPLIGGTSAVVASVDGKVLGISETFGQVSNAGYTLRTINGDVFSGSCTAVGNIVTLDIERQAVAGDIIVVGTRNEEGEVTQKYLISSIRPKPDLTAELSLALFDPDVYKTDDGIFPTYDPNFGQTDQESGYHSIVNLNGFSRLEIDGRFPYTVAALTWDVSPDDDNVHRYVIEYIKTGSTEKQFISSVPSSQKFANHKYLNSDNNFGSGIYFVTPLSSLGYLGKGSQIYLSKVNDRSVPRQPEPFYVERLTASDAMRFIWNANRFDDDLAGFAIYKMPAGTTYFDIAVAELYMRVENNRVHSWEDILVAGIFWIVAIDTSGNESKPLAESLYWDLHQTICGNPDWSDVKDGCVTLNEELLIDNSVSITEYAGKSGRYAFYNYLEQTEQGDISNYAVRSFIDTSTNLDSVVIADPEWEPMAAIDPLSWQPDGIHYEVFHEVSVDNGEWQRFHNEVFKAKNLKYRLVLADYKADQDLRVQRACLYIYTTRNLVI